MDCSAPEIGAPGRVRPWASPLFPAATAITATDWWFAALDQRRFTIGREWRTARITGVHIHAFDTWIQLEFVEDPGRSLLLHLPPGAGVDAAVRAIQTMLQRDRVAAFHS